MLHGCIPSREESDKLAENGDKLSTFGEAEIFCYHLSQVKTKPISGTFPFGTFSIDL